MRLRFSRTGAGFRAAGISKGERMKELILLYGVCAAISIASVALTSIIKIVVCAIAKRNGKDVSGNVKEYVFTPVAILFAGLGCYLWLIKLSPEMGEQQFIMTIAAFSLATMLIYLMLFQSTRKIASAIFNALVKKANLDPVVEVVQSVINGTAENEEDKENHLEAETTILQSNAKTSQSTAEKAAASLQEMVEKIKRS